MAYHFINLAFLGISIEGIASDRAIEILEKRGLLSQVGGGAIAGAITPPLFSASIFLPQSRCRRNVHSFSNKPSGGLQKKGAMSLTINTEAVRKTTKCSSGFKCLTDETHPCCAPASTLIEGYGLFVHTARQHACPYKISFGNGFICYCPSRYEIFLRYKR